ncbi:unnamed protein product [Pseudo-nitzschia multistriata]|uniref:Ribosomal RNA large subunit methyltransferase K/L-like methyltransferase domain-containing protein n=1 Tax=Pseudo-nitzschia multistriata TaxID=183589 RepID=A0A448ZQW7_9STRA|nr:unnamed protein product [Pseudo-nitzschia multistriata]
MPTFSSRSWRWNCSCFVAWAVATVALPVQTRQSSIACCRGDKLRATTRRNSNIYADADSTLDVNLNFDNLLAFSIVPASTNPSNKFTKSFLEKAVHRLPSDPHTLVPTIDVRLLEANNGGRLSFRVPIPSQGTNDRILDDYCDGNRNDTTEEDSSTAVANQSVSFSEWNRWLSPYGMKSLRLVICECRVATDPGHTDASDESSSTAWTSEERIWSALEANLPSQLPWEIYESFGNTVPEHTATRQTKDGNDISEEAPSHQKNPQIHPTRFDVTCRRWSTFRCLSKDEFSSTRTKATLRKLLLRKYGCLEQPRDPESAAAHASGSNRPLQDCDFHLLMYGADNTLRLEWTMLAPPTTKKFSNEDYLPKPGCKRVEAWMLMRDLRDGVLARAASCNKNEEVIVLDPLCGKATFLVEAATTWGIENSTPMNGANTNDDRASVSFIGVDASSQQLEDAAENVEAVAEALGGDCTIELRQGDSRDLSRLGFGDGSVAAIATCPPFGRQFFSLGDDAAERRAASDGGATKRTNEALQASYRDWLREWTRVLDPHHGRIALLVDVDHQAEALAAIRATGSLRVRVLREPFRLGRLKATVIVADADPNNKADDGGCNSSGVLKRFPWEGTAKEARAEWSRLRTESLQELVPYTNTLRNC